jgi:hypothetical protein
MVANATIWYQWPGLCDTIIALSRKEVGGKKN